MAEYLSKKYLQSMIDKWKNQYEDFEGENKNSKLRKKLIIKGYNECETIIEQAPTADVVEVVRCKDCKHWIYWSDSKTCSCKIHHICTMKDDFCSYGERRTDNDLQRLYSS